MTATEMNKNTPQKKAERGVLGDRFRWASRLAVFKNGRGETELYKENLRTLRKPGGDIKKRVKA